MQFESSRCAIEGVPSCSQKPEARLFLGGLSFTTTEASLEAYFELFGELISSETNVMRDAATTVSADSLLVPRLYTLAPTHSRARPPFEKRLSDDPFLNMRFFRFASAEVSRLWVHNVPRREERAQGIDI